MSEININYLVSSDIFFKRKFYLAKSEEIDVLTKKCLFIFNNLKSLYYKAVFITVLSKQLNFLGDIGVQFIDWFDSEQRIGSNYFKNLYHLVDNLSKVETIDNYIQVVYNGMYFVEGESNYNSLFILGCLYCNVDLKQVNIIKKINSELCILSSVDVSKLQAVSDFIVLIKNY